LDSTKWALTGRRWTACVHVEALDLGGGEAWSFGMSWDISAVRRASRR
jgi:hypothetical protein